MNKKLVFVIIIVLLIIAGVYMAKKASKSDENIQTAGNMVNELVDDIEIVLENDLTANLVEINTTVENKTETEKTTGAANIASAKPEEKAIEIVKQNWGQDDSVYYSYDGIDSKGNYIICVRDKNTTKALYFYYVNVDTGTFDIE